MALSTAPTEKVLIGVVAFSDGGLVVQPPSDDLNALKKMTDFWVELGETTDADYIVAAAIDVKVLDPKTNQQVELTPEIVEGALQ